MTPLKLNFSMFRFLFPILRAAGKDADQLWAATNLLRAFKMALLGEEALQMAPLLLDGAQATALVLRFDKRSATQGFGREQLKSLDLAVSSVDAQIFPVYIVLLLFEAYHIMRGTPHGSFFYMTLSLSALALAFEFIALAAMAFIVLRGWHTKAIFSLFLVIVAWLVRKMALLAIPLGAVFCIGEFRGYLIRLGSCTREQLIPEEPPASSRNPRREPSGHRTQKV